MGYHSKKNIEGYPLTILGLIAQSLIIIALFYFFGSLRGWYLVLTIVLLIIFTILGVKGHTTRKKLVKSNRFKFDLIVLILIIILMICIIYSSKDLS